MKSTKLALSAGLLLATTTISQAAVLIDSSGITATAPSLAGDFGPENTLDGLTLEGFTNAGTAGPPARPANHQGNHWITDGILSTSIIFDLGGAYDLAQLEVLNTSNTNWNDRETDTFTIETSTDGISYSAPSAAVTLQDYTLGFQTVPLIGTAITHVRLNVTNDPAAGTNTGTGDVAVGLNEVRFFEANAIPEPTGALLSLIGSVFLLRRKR